MKKIAEHLGDWSMKPCLAGIGGGMYGSFSTAQHEAGMETLLNKADDTLAKPQPKTVTRGAAEPDMTESELEEIERYITNHLDKQEEKLHKAAEPLKKYGIDSKKMSQEVEDKIRPTKIEEKAEDKPARAADKVVARANTPLK